ncbi:MAG: hypothetical protein LBF94_02040 [Puniceicoccales bacterium]|nr:hypothetical protein [Puniceicoccales bacterium]
MKKIVKIIVFISLFAFGIFLFPCLPFVQRLIVKGILSHYFDDVRIPKASIGFSEVKAKNVCMRYKDMTIRFADLDVKWSLKDWFSQKILSVKSATLDGLMFSFENEPTDVLYFEKKKARIAAKFDVDHALSRVFQQLNKLSVLCSKPVAIGKLSVNGSFDVYEKILGDFSFDVLNFARAKTADISFTLDSDFTGQLVGKLKISGHSSIDRDISGAINSMSLNSFIDSKDGTAKNEKSFLLNAAYARPTAAGNLLQLTFIDEQNLDKILDASCEFDDKSQNMRFNFDVKLTDQEAKYFAFGADIKPFLCHLCSTGEYNLPQANGLAKSSFEATFSNEIFDRVVPELKNNIKVRIVFSLGIFGENIEIQSIKGEIGDEEKKQIACSLELPDKYRFHWSKSSPLKSLNGLSISINVDNIDTAILGAIYSNWHLHSLISGKCILAFKNNQLNIYSDAKRFHMTPMSLIRGGNKIFDEFECSFEPRIVIGDVIKCDITGLTCTDKKGASVIEGSLTFTLDDSFRSCSGNLVCDLADLLKQPIFKNDLKVSSGLASGDFNLVQKDHFYTGNAELKLKAVNYGEDKTPLNGNLDVVVGTTPTKNEMKFNISGSLHNTMDSDVLINGIVGVTNNKKEALDSNIRVDIRSSVICLSDIVILSKLFAMKEFQSPGPQDEFFAKRIESSRVSLWDEILFDASIQANALYMNDVQLCSDLSCGLKVNPKTINLQNMMCSVFGASFLGSGSITFASDDYEGTYNAKAYFSLSDLSASKCMLLLKRDPRAFTGIFGAKGSLSASQRLLSDLLPHIQGKVDVVGINGNISPMKLLSNTQKGFIGIVGIADSLLNTNIANDVILAFENIPYDKMSTSIIRQSNGDIILDSSIIVGENIRMVANGMVTSKVGYPFQDYGLRVESQISTKGSMTELFSRLGWTTDKAFDYYGYRLGPKVNIGGTVGNPNLSDLKMLIGTATTKILAEQGTNGAPQPIINPETLLKMFQK